MKIISQEIFDELLDYLVENIKKNGYSPTQQTMADHFKVARYTIQNRLSHLEAQGKVINNGRRGFLPVK